MSGYGHRPPCPLIPDASQPRGLLADDAGCARVGGWVRVWSGWASSAPGRSTCGSVHATFVFHLSGAHDVMGAY